MHILNMYSCRVHGIKTYYTGLYLHVSVEEDMTRFATRYVRFRWPWPGPFDCMATGYDGFHVLGLIMFDPCPSGNPTDPSQIEFQSKSRSPL